MEQGSLVEHLSEVDQQVFSDTDRQALILRPSARLVGGRRYAVAVTRSARTLDGKVPASPPGWEAILAQTATEPLAKKQAARMPEILKALKAAGVEKDQLVLAWDFVVASDENLTHSMRSMRAQTLAILKDGPLGYTVESTEDDFNPRTLRRIRGTFKAPKFLTETDVAVADATLTFDAKGDPIVNGTYDAPFTLILPRSATKGPVKLLLFGHGFLGTGEGEIGGAEGSYLQILRTKRVTRSSPPTGSASLATRATTPRAAGPPRSPSRHLSLAPWIGDRLHQSLITTLTLARTARDSIAADPALFVGGQQVIDASRIDYSGISLRGVMGSALMGYSPDLSAASSTSGLGWAPLPMQRLQQLDARKLLLRHGLTTDQLEIGRYCSTSCRRTSTRWTG